MAESGAVQFFCVQALGIMIEDGVQYLHRRLFKRDSGAQHSLLERCIGYAWVLAFLVWTTPVWIFPVTRILRMEDDLLSLEAIKPVLFGR